MHSGPGQLKGLQDRVRGQGALAEASACPRPQPLPEGSPRPRQCPHASHLGSPDHQLSVSGDFPMGLPTKSSPDSAPARPAPPSATCWKHEGEMPQTGCGHLCEHQSKSLSCGESPSASVITVRNKDHPWMLRPPCSRHPSFQQAPKTHQRMHHLGKPTTVCLISTSSDGRGHPPTKPHVKGQHAVQGKAPTHAGFLGAAGSPSALGLLLWTLEAPSITFHQSPGLLFC